MMGKTSWYLLFSIRLFGKVEAQPIHVAQGESGVVNRQDCGRQAGNNSSCTPGFVFNAYVFRSLSSTTDLIFPKSPSGNANVFFLSFWLISEISGWKDCLGSHFFWCWQNWVNIPPATHPHIYPSLPPATQLQVQAITAREERRERERMEGKRAEGMKMRNKERKRRYFVQTE